MPLGAEHLVRRLTVAVLSGMSACGLAVSAGQALQPTPAISIISPNGGEWWLSGARENITWNVGEAIARVNLEFSADGGRSWSTIVRNARNDGVQPWLIPDTVSNQAFIRITGAEGGGAADLSDAAFVLTRAPLVHFTIAGDNPVLQPGPAGSWDESVRERGWFMYEDGGYHMWYGGWRGAYQRSQASLVEIGYATSSDGVHWNKYPGSPISSSVWAEDFVVLKSGGTYYLYAEDEFNGGAGGDGAHIDLYTSTDKINWAHQGTVLAHGSSGWERDEVGTPVVWKEGGNWYMLYEGAGPNSAGQVGLATSADGYHWTRNPNNPVLANPKNGDLDIALDSIIKCSGVYHAYGHYNIGSDTWAGGLFISSDLRSWTAYPGNPITGSSPVIVDNGENYFLYSVQQLAAEQYQYQMASSPHAVAPSSTALKLHSPNGGEQWSTGSVQVIQWQPDTFSSEVKLECSVDAGRNWAMISTVSAAEGSYNWLLPHAVSKQCWVKISGVQGAGPGDMSDAAFEITAAPAGDFMDDFSAAQLDTAIWQRGVNVGNRADLLQGALHLHSANSASGWVYTRNRFSGRNKTVQVEVVQPNGDGALGMSPTLQPGAATGFFNEADWYRFYNYRDGESGPYKLFVAWKRSGSAGGREVAPEADFYGPFELRLRTNDTHIFFEYSFDNSQWITAYSELFALPGYTLDNLFAFELSANNTPAKGEWIVDDFMIHSLPPPSSDISSPVISQASASEVGASSATLTWITNEPADTQAEYGLTTAYGSQSSYQTARVTSHAVALSGLAAQTAYHYLLKSRDAAGNLGVSADLNFRTGVLTHAEARAELPAVLDLECFPNPFNLATRLRFELSRPAAVNVAIFDLAGHTVQEMAQGSFTSGRHELFWHGECAGGETAGTGIYFVRLQYHILRSAQAGQILRRVLLLK